MPDRSSPYTSPEEGSTGPDFVQALARGLSVITAFDADRSVLTLSEVARATALSRATARRSLRTLVELGYVRADGSRFALTPQVLRLGTAYLSGLRLPALAQPHLDRLAAELEESTSVAVLDGTDVVYVARVAKRRIMTAEITVGTRFPAFATSMGRVLLAGLDPDALDAYFRRADLTPPTERSLHTEPELRVVLRRVHEQGWALTDQELAPGLRAVAAPVVDRSGAVVAAINVSTTEPGRAEQVREPLLEAARRISADVQLAGA